MRATASHATANLVSIRRLTMAALERDSLVIRKKDGTVYEAGGVCFGVVGSFDPARPFAQWRCVQRIYHAGRCTADLRVVFLGSLTMRRGGRQARR